MKSGTSDTPRLARGSHHLLTGLTSWTVALVTLVCLVRFPRTWAYVVAIALGLFVVRALFVAVYSIIGSRACREWGRRDWTRDDEIPGSDGPAAADVRHIILLPNYKEPLAVLRRTLDALAVQHRAAERLIVVLGMEEKEQGSAAKGSILAEEYAGRFLDVLVTSHPAGLPGEVAGKSSNQAWQLKEVTRRVSDLGLDPDLVTVTSCDADSVIHPSYFAAVSRLFADAEDRHSRFWQAPMQYLNNIWRVPAPVRFVTWFGQAWMRANLAMPFYASFPISTYTLSLRLAVDAGGWDPGVIPEDWHMFLRCFFVRGERVGLTPVFLPTNADAPEEAGWVSGMRTAYQQCVRHSWGAEDVGYVLKEMRERGFGVRAAARFTQIYSDHVFRATGWFLVVSAYLLAGSSRVGYRGFLDGTFLDVGARGSLLHWLLATGAVLMLGTLVLEIIRSRPPREFSRGRLVVEQVVMWLALPLVGLYLGVLPTMQAQTMLMFGIPLAYKVTPKRVDAAPDALAGAVQQSASET